MAANDPKFYARAQSMVQNIIDGINSKKAALQQSINELNSIVGGGGYSGGSTGGGTTPPAGGGGGSSGGGGGGGGGGGKINKFAEGAYVKARRGGTLAIIAENGDDEAVLSRQHAVPMLTQALATVMRSQAVSGAGGGISRADLVGAFKEAVRDMLNGLPDINNYVVVDGHVIDKRIVRAFGGLQQEVRG
jgi:hypothetical protein